MQGQRHQIRSKLRRDLKPTVITNWQIWVPFQFVNFRFIPLHLQVCRSLAACARASCKQLQFALTHSQPPRCQWDWRLPKASLQADVEPAAPVSCHTARLSKQAMQQVLGHILC